MSRPADAAQRAQALDLSRSFIVQAPAGSGKTELLTQRFLKLLAQVDRPERILAITFTRKATREMHERIIRRLRQASEGQQTQNEHELEHEKLAVELARTALEKDAAQGWNLLRNPGRLRVHTIDGLCTQLLARDPDRGGHVSGRKVLEDPGDAYREAVRRMFEDLGQDDAGIEGARAALVRVLVHLDGDSQALQDLLVSMLKVRDQWTGKIGVEQGDLQWVLNDRQEQELARFHAVFDAGLLAQAISLAVELGSAVEDMSSVAGRLAAAAQTGQKTSADATAVAHWFSKLFMTSSGTPCKPSSVSARLFKGLPKSLATRIPELRDLYSRWYESPESMAAIERMALMPAINLEPVSDTLTEDIRTVLKQSLAQLRVLFAERGVADFQFITEAALESLGDAERPGEVLLSEDRRLGHILMDEFQDTSNTQFALLRRLVEGWSGGPERTLFLVGDPMQSIYRFREANVGLFIDVVQRGSFEAVPLHYLQLQSNFRSRDEIVDWVNAQFAGIFPGQSQRDSGAVSYARAEGESGPGGMVGLHVLPGKSTDDDEAELAIRLIQEAQSDLADPSIAVLVRSRTHLAALARGLIRQGIAFEAVKVDALGIRPVVNDLLAITRALSHPGDRVAWLALLRAPWCGLDLVRLHRVAGANVHDDPHADLFERIGSIVAAPPADFGDIGPLARLHQVLNHCLQVRGSHSLRDCVEYAWLHLGGPYCYASPAELRNAETYLRYLSTLEQESSVDLVSRVTEGLKELYALSSSSRLQLMTIHQAKGLEFDVVIMPGLHRGTGRGDKPLVAVQEFRMADDRDAVLIAPLPESGADAPSVYGYLAAVDAERGGYEDQRVLYVAATRARQRLHLLARCGRKKNGDVKATSGTFLKLLLPAFESLPGISEDEVTDAEEDTPQPQSQPFPLLRLQGAPRLPELAEGLPERAVAELREPPRLQSVALGEALHYWLELIHDHWDRGWTGEWIDAHPDALASSLRRAGLPDHRIAALLPELSRMIRQAVATETGRAMVSPERKRESWSEVVLYRREGNGVSRHIIDRLFQTEDGRWTIVDYKSGVDYKTGDGTEGTLEKWQSQLARYRSLVHGLDSGEVSGTLVHQTHDNTIIDLSRETTASQKGDGS